MSKTVAIVEETKADAFVRLAVKRTNAAIARIALIGNLGGSQYDSTPEQRAAIEKALVKALADAMGRLNHVKSTADTFSL